MSCDDERFAALFLLSGFIWFSRRYRTLRLRIAGLAARRRRAQDMFRWYLRRLA